MIGCSDPDECRRAEEQWMAISEAYWAAFEELKPSLPKSFLAQWEQATGFHDAPVHRLSVDVTREKGVCVTIQLKIDDRLVALKFEDVGHCRLDIAGDAQWPGTWWGYEEIEKALDDRWIVRILFSNNEEIELECKTFEATEEDV